MFVLHRAAAVRSHAVGHRRLQRPQHRQLDPLGACADRRAVVAAGGRPAGPPAFTEVELSRGQRRTHQGSPEASSARSSSAPRWRPSSSPALMLVLLGRLVLLQVIRYDYYTDQAEGNRARIEPIPANRGLILDRNGKVLAENRPSYQLELVREQVGDRKALDQHAGGPGQDRRDPRGRRRRRAPRRAGAAAPSIPCRSALRLSDEEIARVRRASPRIPRRGHPRALHALLPATARSPCTRWATWARSAKQDRKKIDQDAYAGTTLIGKLGRGSGARNRTARRERLPRDPGQCAGPLGAGRRATWKPHCAARSRTPATDVILSLDLPTQQAAEQAFGDRRGAAVAIDPHNGDVLALVSLPGFDPSMFGRGITQRRVRGAQQRHRPAAVQPRDARHSIRPAPPSSR